MSVCKCPLPGFTSLAKSYRQPFWEPLFILIYLKPYGGEKNTKLNLAINCQH
jgi:hypothetical protein